MLGNPEYANCRVKERSLAISEYCERSRTEHSQELYADCFSPFYPQRQWLVTRRNDISPACNALTLTEMPLRLYPAAWIRLRNHRPSASAAGGSEGVLELFFCRNWRSRPA